MVAASNLRLPPAARKLRVYAFDPSLAVQLETATLNELTIEVPWERDPATGKSGLKKGPIGEYIEVVDIDPASGVVYPPVDLDDPDLLAQSGIPPSEGNPQFHQQMVYAVAMATIEHFERALGRVALWASDTTLGRARPRYVPRLRIYPHALRDQNAYYSPDKKALLFGYFPTRLKNAYNTPGVIVFSCLAHDIIAHETTHALLDGVHPRFNEPTNPDVLAFHEAFADIVALFQRFSYPGVLRSQIAAARGDLDGPTLLAQLAQQFGRATGRGGALRDALGSKDPQTGIWTRRPPDPTVLEKTVAPHDRGAILVAALFGAFLAVYKRRTADLFRIATQGTGVLPQGAIHPDLAGRLADEAAAAGRSMLTICIRALDYCPPVDITFGAYLRAVITGDIDLNPEDPYGFRIALIENFRAWGIVPIGVRSMSPESLQYDGGMVAPVSPALGAAEAWTAERPGPGFTDRKSSVEALFKADAATGVKMAQAMTAAAPEAAPDSGPPAGFKFEPWNLDSNREKVWKTASWNGRLLWQWLVKGDGRVWLPVFGLVVDSEAAPRTVYRNKKGEPTVEVHAVRTAIRRGPRGNPVSDLVVEITQRRRGFFEKQQQEIEDGAEGAFPYGTDGDFIYRAGCTVIIDPNAMTVRRVVRTAGTIADDRELERVRAYLTREQGYVGNAFDRDLPPSLRDEDARRVEHFVILHRHDED